MAFWKESMISRLSNLINRNRSAAKISQVLCSSPVTPVSLVTLVSLVTPPLNPSLVTLTSLVSPAGLITPPVWCPGSV